MPAADDSPPEHKHSSSFYRDEVAHYKAQYEQLESELADFQTSSRELEAELEKDIEASEKRERQLQEKVDGLRYEVDEWKAKYKQSKSEGNSALNNLQKEITTLRDTNRTMHLKLRDIEVANDDFERQARNTTSSLEDMESKYNVAIERGVMLEEEIKTGEQERESLRIENQRLRDELSDLKIEAEIVQDRLRHAESNGVRRRKPAPLYRSPSTPHTLEIFDRSPAGTATSSPVFATPPAKPSLASTAATPPSPPISESSASLRKSINATPSFPRSRAAGAEPITSRSLYNSRTAPRTTHSRTPSLAYSNGRSTPTFNPRSSLSRSSLARPSGLPNSGSLYQIRGLIGKMQKLEERVQSAKSRLPAPSDSSSRGSPRAGSRAGSVVGDSPVPSTVTVRRTSRKRISGSSYGSSIRDTESTPSYIPHSRQSFGARTQGDSRPSSRTSFSSRSSFSQSTSGIPTAPPARPESRSSRPGARTPLGHYSTNPTTESRRPRSSLSNHAALGGMTHIEEDNDFSTPTSRPAQDTRRPSIPATPNGLKKRTTSGASGIPTPRSFKTSIGSGTMPPPKPKTQVEELGETY
ncbi:Nuclear distribution protein nudE [Penicillium lagena]|uniref:Nuclear distribution protein nudE n=1 Tax=Penicillium lagena TaxID=94218 RepID=UPI00253F6BEC|nr:Nuclear distribution protein nudE [Penicillium lagena]KAJ5605575.1 Nuclear distribution protein nudE [Penicillium lagena]